MQDPNYIDDKTLKMKLDILITECLVRETAKNDREGQMWLNQPLAKGLATKLTREIMELFKQWGLKMVDEFDSPKGGSVYADMVDEFKHYCKEQIRKNAE